MIFAGQQSTCTQVQKYAFNLVVGADIALAKIIMTDDEIICKAAEYQNSNYLKYCLRNKIGSLSSVNAEGRTPLSIAMFLKNKSTLKIIGREIAKDLSIEKKMVKKSSSPRTVAIITPESTPASSPVTLKKKND